MLDRNRDRGECKRVLLPQILMYISVDIPRKQDVGTPVFIAERCIAPLSGWDSL
jgi:hypothetical protein